LRARPRRRSVGAEVREHTTPEEQRRRKPAKPAAARAAAPAEAMLLLQRQAGNRAVAGLLAREPTAEPATGTSLTLDMGKEIGSLPVMSASWARMGENELVISSPMGDYGARIMEAAAKGKVIAVVVLASPAVRSTLYEVVLSSAQIGGRDGDVITFTLNFTKVEHEFAQSD
jgi:hypothetical protein